MNSEVIIGGLYRHYKGNMYRVLQLAKHTETLEPLVVYVNVNDETHVWARPLSMWFDRVGDSLRFTEIKE